MSIIAYSRVAVKYVYHKQLQIINLNKRSFIFSADCSRLIRKCLDSRNLRAALAAGFMGGISSYVFEVLQRIAVIF